jgi:hypothetical protein
MMMTMMMHPNLCRKLQMVVVSTLLWYAKKGGAGGPGSVFAVEFYEAVKVRDRGTKLTAYAYKSRI